jgi:hypothetical protein
VTLRGHEKLGGTGVQKSEEKEGNKRRKKGKENIVWERRETGRKGKKEGRGGLAWRRQRVTKHESGDE